MEVEVRYHGISIGTASLESPTGIAHGMLRTNAGYEHARHAAEAAGVLLVSRGLEWRYWPASRGDFAVAFAAAVAGGYEITELRGEPVPVASVSVLAWPHLEKQPLVVVDFRLMGVRDPAWAPIGPRTV